jgi:hypothetical protein
MKSQAKNNAKGMTIKKICPRQHTDKGLSQNAAGV